jgi:hypothetical protein
MIYQWCQIIVKDKGLPTTLVCIILAVLARYREQRLPIGLCSEQYSEVSMPVAEV